MDSAEDQAIVAAYTNTIGEFSCDLLNKEFIQVANSSKIVFDLVGQQAGLDQLRDHIVKVRFEFAALSGQIFRPARVFQIVTMMEAFSPRPVFRELAEEQHRMLSQATPASRSGDSSTARATPSQRGCVKWGRSF